MDPTPIAATLEQAYSYLLAVGLALCRVAGMILIMPVFTRIGVAGIVRSGIAFAFALPLVPMLAQGLAHEQLTAARIAVLVLKEMAIGTVIGLVLGVPFWAAEAAGDVLDLQRGTNAATLLDPQAAVEEGITGTLLGLTMVALYVTSGGLSLALQAVYDSYEVWPVDRFLPLFGAPAVAIFLGLLDKVVNTGVVIGAPLIVCLFLSDLVLALVSRAAPNLNVFALSLSVKNLVFAILLTLYCVFLIKYMRNDLGSLLAAKDELGAIGTSGHP
jgi:type III secretion protein T